MTIIFDLDGVVYRGDTAVPGAVRALNRLLDEGHTVYFLTNNSTRARSDYVHKLADLGIRTTADNIMTSAYATALYLRSRGAEGRPVFVVGERGLVEEMEAAGLRVVPLDASDRTDFVVVGLDRQFHYNKLARAYEEIMAGAEFVATNRDPTLPLEAGIEIPGSGAIVAAIQFAVGREPFVVGKPETYPLERILELSGATPQEAVMVGDRTDSDVLVGRRLGLPTVLTLTGVTDRATALTAPEDQRPDFIVETLEELPVVLDALADRRSWTEEVKR